MQGLILKAKFNISSREVCQAIVYVELFRITHTLFAIQVFEVELRVTTELVAHAITFPAR